MDGAPAGVLAVADPVKDDSAAAIAALRHLGAEVVMLTGDNAAHRRGDRAQVGVRRVLAEVLPEHKAGEIRRLQAGGARWAWSATASTTPRALAAADVGLAIGTGTDVAIEAADITLISGSLAGVATAIGLSRATMRNIRQNLFFALAYNGIGIPVAAGVLYPAFGIRLSPIIAAAAMAAVLPVSGRQRQPAAPLPPRAPARRRGDQRRATGPGRQRARCRSTPHAGAGHGHAAPQHSKQARPWRPGTGTGGGGGTGGDGDRPGVRHAGGPRGGRGAPRHRCRHRLLLLRWLRRRLRR